MPLPSFALALLLGCSKADLISELDWQRGDILE